MRQAATTEAPTHPSRLAGLALVVLLAVVATSVGTVLPLVGGPVAGVLLGVAVAVVRRPGTRVRPGLRLGTSLLLPLGVVLLGARLELGQLAEIGTGSLPVLVGTLVACLLAATVLGHRLGVGRDLTTLVGAGTAICGASAVAALAPVLRARSQDVTCAMSTIFAFNVAAVLVFPPLGHLLGMDQAAFGLFAGTAVNDTSSVVAAAATYGDEATRHAVVVKLARSLAIIPLCLAVAAVVARREGSGERVRVTRLVPWFLVGFVLMALARAVGLVPEAALPGIEATSTFLVTAALAAIGLSTDLPALRRTGARPLLLGGALWLVVAATSLLLQAAQ